MTDKSTQTNHGNLDAGGSKKHIKAGEAIMVQGERGDSAYIIESGKVEITLQAPDNTEKIVGTRGPGAMIGEMAIIDNAPRTATVRALEDCILLEITADDFSNRLDHSDPILKMTIQVILTRYRDTLIRANIAGENRNRPPPEVAELTHAKHSNAVESVKISNEFKAALDNGEVSLHYQPIVNLKTGEISGFESLMRWEHPERGFISPSIFIPIAEESGAILKASQWALKESCAALQRLEQRTGYNSDLFMSVNFTSRDFAAEGFVDSVYETLSRSDVKPSQLHIEITERMLIDQPESARDTLQMCRKAGIDISIDDFGTGYSSLSYLQYFPISTLKIDRSFIKDMHENEGSMALVKSIIALGKNMNMKIIAEGVEKLEEAQILRDLDCDMAQGYYFAKPMSEIQITGFIKDTSKIEF
ncbi:MAG: EAL domain-containing protein [Alphaproteobacteria bacterium]|nr:EAL domain-containing protein [Alphaproteobacteria bacterium]